MMTRCANGHQPYDKDLWPTSCPDCMPVDPRPSGNTSPIKGTTVDQPAQQQAADKRTVVVQGAGSKRLVGWVVIQQGPQRNTDFRLVEGSNRIGRGTDSAVHLHDPLVSTMHAMICIEDGVCEVVDLGSQNGTFLNDNQRKVSRDQLKSGDIIRMGDTSLKFIRYE
jgi:pSer/pThr/pTyr-binding forkhead associated (FHA) protein